MQHKENLSAYMDGQDVNAEFTKILCESDALQQQWARYHTVRDVMRGEAPLLGADFSAKMAALIENEEIGQARESQPRGQLIKLKRWATPLLQAGVAASVCLIAVLGVNTFNSNSETAQTEQPVLQTLPFSNSVQQVSYNAPQKEQPTAEQLENQQRRINSILQNYELQRRTATGAVAPSEAEKAKAQTSAVENSPQK